jgi:hypothetical protein
VLLLVIVNCGIAEQLLFGTAFALAFQDKANQSEARFCQQLGSARIRDSHYGITKFFPAGFHMPLIGRLVW